jgi:hypothetical protein
MEVRCFACGNAQNFNNELFGNRNSVEIQCAACGRTIRVVNPETQTLRVETTKKAVEPLSAEYTEDGQKLSLPKDKELSLKVVDGPEKGAVYPLVKPRVTIGRVNADVTIDDRTVSRLHCALEIAEDRIVLRDLGSTNGTMINNEPIQTSILESGSTFRIGMHVFQLLVSPRSA